MILKPRDEGIGRFAPDAEMAAAWDRLCKGDFIPNDIKMLLHEDIERRVEKLYHTIYRAAHEATEDRGYTWSYPTEEMLNP